MGSTVQKRYRYEIWRNGAFLSTIPNVTSEFTYNQDINTAGAALTVEVGETADRQREAPEALLTESGEEITTELGETLTTERTPDIMGNNNTLALYRTNNTIKVYEISTYYPTGKLVYSGFISKWKVPLGTGTDKIVLSCLSDGQELSNYLAQGANDTLDVSQTQQDAAFLSRDDGYFSGLGMARPFQEYVPSVGVTNLSSVVFKLAAASASLSQNTTLLVWGPTDGYATPIASVTLNISSTTPADYTFTLPTPITINPGDTYEIGIYPGSSTASSEPGGGVNIYYKTGSVYSGGRFLYRTYNGFNGEVDGFHEIVGDLYFKTYYSSFATNAAFPTQDPTTMLRTIITNYVNRGGAVNYGSGTTDLTATTLSYTFKVNTVLEAIQKILDMAPHDWYWYVDPATATLYFKQASTTADITFIYGRHYQSLEIEASVEQITNDAYFTGGDTGGNVNLFIHQSNATAQIANNNRIGLARITDNRVTLQNTGAVILLNYLTENKNEIYRGTITIPDGLYDNELITIGKIVGFAGHGNLIDTLLLQIVAREKHEEYVKLTLGRLPPRQLAAFTQTEQQLNEAQSQYNPSTPT